MSVPLRPIQVKGWLSLAALFVAATSTLMPREHEAIARNPMTWREYRATDITCIASSGDLLVAAWGDGHITAWSIARQRVLWQSPAQPNTVVDYIYLPSTRPTRIGALLRHPDRAASALAVYAVDAAKATFQHPVPVEMVLGFSADGNQLFWYNAKGDLVSVEPDSGKLVWSAPAQDLPFHHWPAIKIGADAERFCVVMDDAIVCRDKQGKDLWRVECPDTRRLGGTNNLRMPRQSAFGEAVVFFNESTARLAALSMKDGSLLWQLPNTGEDILAAAPAGETVVRGDLAESRLVAPARGAAAVSAELKLHGQVTYSEDGSRILVMSPMKVVLRGNSEAVERASNTIVMYSAKDGRQEMTIQLDPKGQ